ncbi:DUF2848 family protein [Alkalihalophilus lindianensis]|uniref:DUF2848 family protein n=1 Tax=Alkalihalophilus lindianensis TaxID=1630542 RepID=A0ABU3XDS7_9BACI|nr:DUF2848 family protein [Alkalihalophilus lindianensis]MDV2686037.1 DUF2848 family protein [Alkalihalophilus lindianensis]
MNTFTVKVEKDQVTLDVQSVYCIGYSGRNQEKVKEHIVELAELGIPAPEDVPMLYPVRKTSLYTGEEMEVIGTQTSGEAEIVLLFGDSEDEIYVSVGSDHTDRGLETVDINKSKQVCDKPLATKAWPLASVKDHWEELTLSSYVKSDTDEWIPYQNETLKSILPLEDILAYLKKKEVALKNTIVFAGTVPLINGFVYGSGYKLELIDPVTDQRLSCEYGVTTIRD